jgi:predicted DNA-binding protein YlxM (UPF0122 family)
MSIEREIDFRKGVFRGILTEIANERGVTRMAVSQAIKRRTRWVLPILEAKIAERKLLEQRFRDVLAA